MKNKKNIDNINNKNNISDSRITNQDKYLHGRTMKKYTFEKQGNWDHEHCAFCWTTIIPGMQEHTTEDGAYWVCETCFEDFKDKFGWKLK